MQIVTELGELRTRLQLLTKTGQAVGFVPTMGYLHEGHVSLMRLSRSACDATVVSIFVNPTQFGAQEDLAAYPRNIDRDIELCRAAGVSLLFLPKVATVYPKGFETKVLPGSLAEPLCGAFRPGHFEGVATVVTKLLNMVQPRKAFFGQKDYQQLLVIRRLVDDLNLPVEIVMGATVREVDGLAMSSRNAYLSSSERQRARCISEGLFAAEDAFAKGELNVRKLLSLAKSKMKHLDSLQYLELRNAATLEEFDDLLEATAVLAVAGYIGNTRLIDNVILKP